MQVQTFIGLNKVFAESYEHLAKRRVCFHKHYSVNVFFRRSDMIILVPEDGRRIVVLDKIGEKGSCKNCNAVNYQDISFLEKNF